MGRHGRYVIRSGERQQWINKSTDQESFCLATHHQTIRNRGTKNYLLCIRRKLQRKKHKQSCGRPHGGFITGGMFYGLYREWFSSVG